MDKQISRSLSTVDDFKALAQLEQNVRERVSFDEEIAAAFKERAEVIARNMIALNTDLDLTMLTPAEEKIVRAVSEYLAIKKRDGSHASRTLTQLIECTEATLGVQDRTRRQIFGSLDDLKFRSSMTLFCEVPRAEAVFRQALDSYCDGQKDPATLKLLES